MKTIRRDRLLRLAEAGRIVLVDSRHFDDLAGESGTRGPKPVRVVPPGDPDWWRTREPGACYLRRSEFEGAPGRAWENPDGTVTLYVHSNCSYTLRVVEAKSSRTEPRCQTCGHTLLEHEKMGWTCDCNACPWKRAVTCDSA